MNIFRDYEGILGKPETAYLNNTLQEFFDLALEIRNRLGKQGYVLDKYISLLLGAANQRSSCESLNTGFMGDSNFYQLCKDALEGGDTSKEHPLSQKTLEQANSNTSYQEYATKLDLLLVAMANDFTELATEKYFDKERQSVAFVLDIVLLRGLYRDMIGILGDENILERLNLLIRQRFLIVSRVKVFEQSITDDLLRCLIYRDDETNKQVFQLVLDRMNNAK